MITVTFLPMGTCCSATPGAKILAIALRNRVDIRYGCGVCRCGTCGVNILSGTAGLSPMQEAEQALLTQIGLPIEGSVRLACQCRILTGDVKVDLSLQQLYSP